MAGPLRPARAGRAGSPLQLAPSRRPPPARSVFEFALGDFFDPHCPPPSLPSSFELCMQARQRNAGRSWRADRPHGACAHNSYPRLQARVCMQNDGRMRRDGRTTYRIQFSSRYSTGVSYIHVLTVLSAVTATATATTTTSTLRRVAASNLSCVHSLRYAMYQGGLAGTRRATVDW